MKVNYVRFISSTARPGHLNTPDRHRRASRPYGHHGVAQGSGGPCSRTTRAGSPLLLPGVQSPDSGRWSGLDGACPALTSREGETMESARRRRPEGVEYRGRSDGADCLSGEVA